MAIIESGDLGEALLSKGSAIFGEGTVAEAVLHVNTLIGVTGDNLHGEKSVSLHGVLRDGFDFGLKLHPCIFRFYLY
jgi:hypothetical protein